MTAAGRRALDPILRTRLELLEQVGDEVERVIKAVGDQRASAAGEPASKLAGASP